MLAKLTRELPVGDFLYEPKWDGFRAIVFRDGDDVEIGSRNEKPLHALLPRAGRADPRAAPRAVRGRRRDRDRHRARPRLRPAVAAHPSRGQPHREARGGDRRRRSWRFDLLAEGDDDLRALPFAERRERLGARVRDDASRRCCCSRRRRAIPTLAAEWFERFEGAGLDGVIAKPLDGEYREGERTMLKVKHQRTADCVVGGYREHKDGGRRLAAARPVRRRRRAPSRRRREQLRRAAAQAARRRARAVPRRARSTIIRGGSGRRPTPSRGERAATPGRARAGGTRGRTSRGSRCASSSSPRSRTSTCRAIASATPRGSRAGAPTATPSRARTRSSTRPSRSSCAKSSVSEAPDGVATSSRRSGGRSPACRAARRRSTSRGPTEPLPSVFPVTAFATGSGRVRRCSPRRSSRPRATRPRCRRSRSTRATSRPRSAASATSASTASPSGAGFAPLSRFWRAADGWIRTHANYAWHRDRLLGVLGTCDDPEAVGAAIARWPAVDARGCGRRRRRVRGRGALARRVARAPARRRARRAAAPGVAAASVRPCRGCAHRRRAPLDGVRVLDLTRVIAGPVCTRTLAAHGADVLRVDTPALPEIEAQAIDTLVGKRSAFVDLRSPIGDAELEHLLDDADVVVTGYRPGVARPVRARARRARGPPPRARGR